jgi:protease I
MAGKLAGVRVGVLVANEGIEQVELTEPWDAVLGAEGNLQLVAPESGFAQAMNHLEMADRFSVDRTTGDVGAGDFDALILPGGVANPDRLRTDAAAVALVRDMFAAGKPVAVICHGPWTLVEADVVKGRTLTSWPSLQRDITNAGGYWVDEEVVVCTSGPNALVTSRKPDDLKAFCDALIETFSGTTKAT